MGKYFTDQYSLLHFSTGVVAYFIGIRLMIWITLHLLFELIENTQFGIYVINKYLTFWPGGKPEADAFINSMLGDNFYAILGWLSASYLDSLYKGNNS